MFRSRQTFGFPGLFAKLHMATVDDVNKGIEGLPGFLIHFAMPFQGFDPLFPRDFASVVLGDLEGLGKVLAA